MKRNLFLLGSSLTTTLLATNTLQLVSCKFKTKEEKQENEDTKNTGQVILEKATKLKEEIKNIIDDVISNSDNDEWIIDLTDGFSADDYSKIVAKLKDTSSMLGKEHKKKLQEITDITDELLRKVNSKFAEIGDIISNKINNDLGSLGITDFTFELDSNSIVPELTNLSGEQFIKSLQKLLKKQQTVNFLRSSNFSVINKIDEKTDSQKENVITDLPTKIELFKLTTDLNYVFSIGDTKFIGDFRNCELLLTSNRGEYKEVKKLTQKTIENLILNDENSKIVEIISEDKEMPLKYPFIFQNYNLDFSDANVKDEIKSLQLENIKSSKKIAEIIDELEFKSDYVNFEPLNYMKFTNKDVPHKNWDEGCLFYCWNDSMDRFLKGEEIKEKIQKYFGVNKSGFIEQNWDGGWINSKFVEQVKKDGAGENPIIDYSKYYGLGEKADKHSDFLIGYGTTIIRNVHYAGILLSKIEVSTHLVATSEFFDVIFGEFTEYVSTLLETVLNTNTKEEKWKNKGVILRKYYYKGSSLFLQWNFSDPDEWKDIQDEVNSKGTITFNWIMDKILPKRIERDKYHINTGSFPNEARTLLHAEEDVTYIKNDKNDYLIKSNDAPGGLILSIKYGFFKVYLTDSDIRTVWDERDNPGITNAWEKV